MQTHFLHGARANKVRNVLPLVAGLSRAIKLQRLHEPPVFFSTPIGPVTGIAITTVRMLLHDSQSYRYRSECILPLRALGKALVHFRTRLKVPRYLLADTERKLKKPLQVDQSLEIPGSDLLGGCLETIIDLF